MFFMSKLHLSKVLTGVYSMVRIYIKSVVGLKLDALGDNNFNVFNGVDVYKICGWFKIGRIG